jgi:hypothetical protein
MALLVAVAGGIVGSLFGMPQLGFLAGSILGSMIFSGGSKGGPKLKDLHVTGSTYGAAIQWLWGTARIGGNIIWTYVLKQHAHHGGGKGGPATYTYSWTGAVGLCATEQTGPIKNVLKIWADTKLVYDATGESGISKSIPGSGGGGKGGGHHGTGSAVVNGGITSAYNKLGHFRVYLGTQDQMPDPAYETLVGASNATANRGMAYIVFDDVNIDPYGNRVPNWTFQVAGPGTDAPLTQNAFKFNFDGSLGGTPDDFAFAIDTFRQRVYFMSLGGSGSTTTGIYAMDLKTGNQVMASSWARTFAPLDPLGLGLNGALANEGPIVADDGFLWIWGGGGNYGSWVKIDPDTLLAIGHIGTPNPFTPIHGTTTFAHGVVPLVLGNTNCMFVPGTVFHDLTLLTLDGMDAIGTGTYAEDDFRVCGGNQVSSGEADIWAVATPAFPSTNSLKIYHIPASLSLTTIVPSLVGSVAPSDIDPSWTTWDNVSGVQFDATDGNIMFFVKANNSVTGPKQYLVKVNTLTAAVMWKSGYENTPGSSENLPQTVFSSYQSIVTTGTYSVIDNHHNVWTFTTQDGTSVKNLWVGNLSAGTQAWADPYGAILFFGDDNQITPVPLVSNWGVIVTNQAANGTELMKIVADICHAVGYVDADIDVSTLTDDVPGYILDSQMNAKDGILPLALAYLFDGVESDYILKFVKRGGASIATIPSTDLAYLDKKLNMIVNETRLQEVDLPNQIEINFLDPNHNYQQATQYARRPAFPYPTMFSKAAHTENLPLVQEPGFMKQLAEKLLFTSWIERVSYKVTLPWQYLIYDPTDVLTLFLTDDSSNIVRMSTVNIGADYSMQWEALSQSTQTYASTATASGGDGFIQQTLGPSAATRLFLLDIPLLRDTDDTGQSFTILYDTAAGYSTPWAGAFIAESPDELTWTDEPVIQTANAAIFGVAVNALGDVANPWIVDNTNTLTVNMSNNGGASLANATLLEVCNGANVAVLYNTVTGEIEIIQWMTVTANMDGSYTLSGLLRGRRGTDVYTGSHAVGDVFILCTTTTLSSIKMALSDLNVVRHFRATTQGTLTEDAPVKDFTDTGRALQPYQPAQQTATLSGSDIQLHWVRRTRVGGELRDLTGDVPLSEQSEAYQVDIYNAGGTAIVRSVGVSYPTSPEPNPGFLYTAAMITADGFGGTPTSLIVNIRQVSTIIGAGLGKKQTLTVM